MQGHLAIIWVSKPCIGCTKRAGMFGFFKKQKIKTNEQALQSLFAQFTLNHQPFHHFIVAQTINHDKLDVSLKIEHPINEQQLQTIHNALQEQLYALGIVELNFNVIVSDKVATMSDTAQIHTPNTIPEHKDNQTGKSAPMQKDIAPHPRIRHIIVVASGKGGVGKSTTAVNIALALKQLGNQVGILDADIYGPSIPDMLGVAGVRPMVENDQFIPIDVDGLAVLSIGSLLDGDSTPVAWRGIKATGALMQLYGQTNWPNLDYLVIDMPPGTGDIQLTLAQRIPITGAIIVTTPQHIALLDAKKGIEMFGKTNIAIIGIIENMALHTCSNCGHTEAIFGGGGADEMVATYGVPLLGRLPLAGAIREQVDKGMPSVMVGDAYAPHYLNIAQNIQTHIGQFAKVRTDGRIF